MEIFYFFHKLFSLITLLIFLFYVKLDIVLDTFKQINSFDKYIARTFWRKKLVCVHKLQEIYKMSPSSQYGWAVMSHNLEFRIQWKLKFELSERHFPKKSSKVGNTANGGPLIYLHMEQACLSTDNDYPINIGKSRSFILFLWKPLFNFIFRPQFSTHFHPLRQNSLRKVLP